MSPDATGSFRPDFPLDVRRTLGPLHRGPSDPTFAAEPDGALWRTSWTPDGPASLRLHLVRGGVDAAAWGPGAGWVIAGLPALLGASHECRDLELDHPLLRQTARRFPGLRMPVSRRVFETLALVVLEQKVTGREAHRSWRELLGRFGTPAPGPAPNRLRVPPPAPVWARIPSWEWHRAGVDGKRSRAIVAAAAVARRLEECAGLPLAAATARLTALPGIGVWTAAEVTVRALGDCDAVSFGDFHVPALVGWALLGRPVDDAGLARLLERYRPHRGRVVRLLEVSGFRKPRFGPRYAAQDMRAI